MLDVLSVLISAVGGQGGAVLTEWLTQAAVRDGYPVQSTSIPGVANAVQNNQDSVLIILDNF